ncbi:septum formation initiator family protein [Luteolibacter sp. LG18]|uniref:FtsB family cell division protein n=1 Tax=Luteolibacter sp. LG18 TaxID=2819286 RepID=UPI0030C6ACAF
MARKRKPISPKVTRLEARTRAIGVVNRFLFFTLCLSVGFVVVAAAVPQKHKLDEMESHVAEARQRQAAVVAERDDSLALYRALREDPACLEQYARDRLDYYREGERVLRIKRGQ